MNPRPHKYGAKPTTVDGIRFDSKREAARWQELRLLERAGEISGLERQPRIRCAVAGAHICEYRPDFRYVEPGAGIVYEDVKSAPTKTPVYRLKRKLVEALYPGTVIREVA